MASLTTPSPCRPAPPEYQVNTTFFFLASVYWCRAAAPETSRIIRVFPLRIWIWDNESIGCGGSGYCRSNQSHAQPWLWEVGQVVLQRGERGTSRKPKGEKAPVEGLAALASFMSRKPSCPSREPLLALELHWVSLSFIQLGSLYQKYAFCPT